MRRFPLGAAVGLIAIVLVSNTAVAGGITYGWTVSRLAAGYTEYEPPPPDEGLNGGYTSTIALLSTGNYLVTLKHVGIPPVSGGYGGVAQVTPLGTAPRICTLLEWGNNGSDETVYVRCWNYAGRLANSAFAVTWSSVGCCSGQLAYFWADKPSATNYNPNSGYSHNSTGGTNHVHRTSVGHYTVSLPGLGGYLGNVQVVAEHSRPATCTVDGWGTISSTQYAYVVCRNRTGSFIDTQYAFGYVAANNQFGSTGDRGAYIWADKPSSSSYVPSADFNWESNANSVRVTRTSNGVYTASLRGFTGIGGSAQVTAYGHDPVRCQLGGLPTSGGTQTVGVRCFNYSGSPTNARYSLVYSR
jgi:hypothetical protein